MTTDMSRRQMLGATAGAGIGIVLAGSIEAVAGAGTALAATRSARGYGALVPDPAGLLSLPAGFSYRIVAQAGETAAGRRRGPHRLHAQRRRRHRRLRAARRLDPGQQPRDRRHASRTASRRCPA